MQIIDVDAHFMEPLTWLDDINQPLADTLDDRLPPAQGAEFIFGEVLANMPDDLHDRVIGSLDGRQGLIAQLMSGSRRELMAKIESGELPFASIMYQKGAYDVADRLEVIEASGIDMQILNPTVALGTLQRVRRFAPDLYADVVRSYNDWATQTLAGHTDRLVPIAAMTFADPDWAVAELRRTRDLGCRGYLLPLYPEAGKALAHEDNEPIWAASVELGMVPIVHVAGGSVQFDPLWCATGREDEGRAAFHMASSLNAQIPQIPLSNLVVNGVLDRHPDLKVLCSEFGLSWVPGWLEKLGPSGIGFLMPWPYRPPREIVTEQIRFSPLRGQVVCPLLDDLGPQSVLFASDYPHPEGSANAVEDFRSELDTAGTSSEVVEAFYGANAVELFKLAS